MKDESPAELQAALLRLKASVLRCHAARADLAAVAVTTGESIRQFAEAYQSSMDSEMWEHPDVQHMDVQFEGFYGDTPK